MSARLIVSSGTSGRSGSQVMICIGLEINGYLPAEF